ETYFSRIATKPELSKATELTLPTIHNFMNELLSHEIVKVHGSADSQGGRRATLYEFNTSLFQILAVRMTLTSIDIGLFDIGFLCLQEMQYKIDFLNMTVDEGMQQIIFFISECLQTWNVERTSLLGIGTTFPGPVEPVSGIIRDLPNLRHWNSVPAKSILERALNIPVFVEKDSLSNVVGLKWLNHTDLSSIRNVVYVAIELGVGIGLLVNSQLYRGENCMMGEIGHISIDPSGPLCNCGNRGCLELYASDIGILQHIRDRVQAGQDPIIYSLCKGQLDHIDMSMVLHAEEMGDLIAREEMEFCLKYIAICIVNIIKLYDPDKIILGHKWLNKYPDMFQRVLENVFMNPLFAHRESVTIELNKIENLELKAAATVPMDHQFSSVDNCAFLKLLN
ncbi:MAG: ROK family protein, partial [Ruminiclostridium sp.]